MLRAGGRVSIREAELLRARTTLARVDADPLVMVVEIIAGDPPDVPRFDADAPPSEVELLARELVAMQFQSTPASLNRRAALGTDLAALILDDLRFDGPRVVPRGDGMSAVSTWFAATSWKPSNGLEPSTPSL